MYEAKRNSTSKATIKNEEEEKGGNREDIKGEDRGEGRTRRSSTHNKAHITKHT